MTSNNRTKTKPKRKRQSIIELSYTRARAFLLKQESYCTVQLPSYFKFNSLLNGVAKLLKNSSLSSMQDRKKLRSLDRVNHKILSTKDGKYAWRPLELIHPALYVSLVNHITEQNHWKEICDRFRFFLGANTKIECLSLPVESLISKRSDSAEQISQWWEDVEQKSIALSLDYEFTIHTDIVDCYAAMYTHSIAWALHGKQQAKQQRANNQLIGNIIDDHLQDMRHGQTNGIPQGSVLMDFIAEMVLGYADTELTYKIANQNIEDYRILRYRDDYRIFVNNPQDGENILKCLTEVMIDLGLKLNSAKTKISSDVIRSSIKTEKLRWMFREPRDMKLQKHLLVIHHHSMEHPEAGSVRRAMSDYNRRLHCLKAHTLPITIGQHRC